MRCSQSFHEQSSNRSHTDSASRSSGHLSNLGHTINPNDWQRGQWSYHNNCLNCGSSVNFTSATGEMRGEALDKLCPKSDQYTIRRREASRK